MVAHEKRNSGQLFCTVPTRNDLTLSSLIFSAQPTQKLGYPRTLLPENTPLIISYSARWRCTCSTVCRYCSAAVSALTLSGEPISRKLPSSSLTP